MLDSFPVSIAVGCILGTLAALGVGGGSLLLIWLTVVIGVSQSTAQMINLLFFIPPALVCSAFRYKQGILDWKKVLPAVIAGCIAAIAFRLIRERIDDTVLKKIFGCILLLVGLKELFYRPQNAK